MTKGTTNIDFHAFLNRTGYWVVRVPREAIDIHPHRGVNTHDQIAAAKRWR